jgi:hypothetical protein
MNTNKKLTAKDFVKPAMLDILYPPSSMNSYQVRSLLLCFSRNPNSALGKNTLLFSHVYL